MSTSSAIRIPIAPGMHIDIAVDRCTARPHACIETATPAIRMAAAMLASRVRPRMEIEGLEGVGVDPDLAETIARDAEAALARTIRILAEEHCRNAITRTVASRAAEAVHANGRDRTHPLQLTVPIAQGIRLDETIAPERLATLTADAGDPDIAAEHVCEALDDAIADTAAQLAGIVCITTSVEAPGLPTADLEPSRATSRRTSSVPATTTAPRHATTSSTSTACGSYATRRPPQPAAHCESCATPCSPPTHPSNPRASITKTPY